MHAGRHELRLASNVCANEHGGYLPLPLNDQENSDYFQAFQELQGNELGVPLDLTDRAEEGTFVRISNGEVPSYTHWSELVNEPDNKQGNEDYVFMLMMSGPIQSTWWDFQDNAYVQVICETDAI